MNIIELDSNFIKQLLNSSSTILVGRILKRFELLENKEDLKKNIKELIYEHFRDLQINIESFSYGVIFKDKPKKE